MNDRELAPLRGRHSLADWSDALAHPSTIHGAGAAAAITAAIGSALLAMSARRPGLGPGADAAEALVYEADGLREELLLLAEEDVLASAGEEAARALPEADADAAQLRWVNLTAALIGSSEVQIAVLRLARNAVALARRLIDLGETDQAEAMAGALLAAAAARAAYLRARGALREVSGGPAHDSDRGLDDMTREKTTGLLKQGARLLELTDLDERHIRSVAAFGL
jgi:formiminotetrahydrofolate cyclodeaminase